MGDTAPPPDAAAPARHPGRPPVRPHGPDRQAAQHRRSRRGLDWLNFFVADVQTGFGPFIGRISVIANNNPTALATLSNAVAKQEGAISNLKIVHRQQDFFEALVDVEVRDLRHLGQVIAGLRGEAGIAQVERAKA